MKRNPPPVAMQRLGPREMAEVQAGALPLRLVLHYETTPPGWPDIRLAEAFWESDRVPEQFRGTEAPGRPDPRAVLSDRPSVVAAFERAHIKWEQEAVKWRRNRLTWLRRAARKEK